jgi:hypothetical protein
MSFLRKEDDKEWKEFMTKIQIPEDIREMKLDDIKMYDSQNTNVKIDNYSLTAILIEMLKEYTPNKIKCKSTSGYSVASYSYSEDLFDIPYDKFSKLKVRIHSGSSPEIQFPCIITGTTKIYKLDIADKIKRMGFWITKNKIKIVLQYDVHNFVEKDHTEGIQNYDMDRFSKQFQNYLHKYEIRI